MALPIGDLLSTNQYTGERLPIGIDEAFQLDPQPIRQPVVVGEEAYDLDDVVDAGVGEAGGAEDLDVLALHGAGLAGELDGEVEHRPVRRGKLGGGRGVLVALAQGEDQRLTPFSLICDLDTEVVGM